jgi:hypothetical protein
VSDIGQRPSSLQRSGARPPPPPEAGKLRREQRADGPACVLAAGTANPANCIPQDEFADWYFRVTKSDHLTHLKDAMKKACKFVTRSVFSFLFFSFERKIEMFK